MTQVPDNSYEQALEFMSKDFPEAVGRTPQWPRFDIFKVAFAAASEDNILLNQAVAACDLTGTVTQMAKTISGLMKLSVVMGVDMRPIMAALHNSQMTSGEPDIATLLLLQDALPVPTLPPKDE